MIRLGLRLTVTGGREALARLVLVVLAVAIGVGLLLATLATLNAVNTQNGRYAWLESRFDDNPHPATSPLWWRVRADYFHGDLIGRVDVAATGPDAPVPPGIPRLPGPGEYYASPALAALLRDHPSAELADRYPGRRIGAIGDAALPAPDTLLVVIGHRAAQATESAGYDRVTSISTRSPGECQGDCLPGVGIDRNGITLILGVVAAALLFPVLIFIGGATRLSAARREHRFAAMRLVGATPRQIAIVATVESALGAAVGTVLGFAVFFALRPVLASIPFTGSRFFVADVRLSVVDVVLTVVCIPLGAAVAARLALRRVTISPLGVERRTTPPAPRAWRLLPTLAGVGWLWYLAYVSDIKNSARSTPELQALAYLAGILLVMGGLVVAGPWLTRLGGRLVARRSARPASLIAARRLADNPQAGFRAVSGLVLALFVGTCALGIITTIDANNVDASGPSGAARDTVIAMVGLGPQSTESTPVVPDGLTRELAATPGVRGFAAVRAAPVSDPTAFPQHFYADCGELAHVPALGRCPSGATVVEIDPHYGGAFIDRTTMADSVWPVAHLSVARFATYPVDTVAVATDGSTAGVERARTLVELAFPRTIAPQTIVEIATSHHAEVESYQRLAEVVILTSLPIAGCSLAVSVAGGLAERRRPFGLLRLAGTPLATLRRVVLFETAGPLLAAAVVSMAAGLVTAHLFVRAQLDETLHAPPSGYYLLVGAGLVASLAVVGSTLPLLRRATGPEAVRND